jgi:hypothetical protein
MPADLVMNNYVEQWLALKDSLLSHPGALPAGAGPQGAIYERWLPEARLLRVLPCGPEYAIAIQHTFQQRRGSVLLLSILDWLAVDTLAKAGIPMRAICNGIHEAFDRFERGPANATRSINSLTFCWQQILRECERMKECSVGTHATDRNFVPAGQTFLVALPPSGRKIFAAMAEQDKLNALCRRSDSGIAFTVYPDAWQKAEALRRGNVHLEFMDPEIPPGLTSFSGAAALAGRTHRRSRQNFMRCS